MRHLRRLEVQVRQGARNGAYGRPRPSSSPKRTIKAKKRKPKTPAVAVIFLLLKGQELRDLRVAQLPALRKAPPKEVKGNGR